MLPSVPAPVEAGAGTPPSGGRQVRTGEEEGLAGVESWAQRPFAREVTHGRLDAAAAAGHRPRTVPSGAVPDDALVLVVLTAGGGWTAEVGGARSPGDRLIVLDPAPAPGAPPGPGERRPGDGTRHERHG